ncbi:unnamed protein product [Adineta steineri]|uniref:LITAF domain-containing protein n=2 Tax=Adineta steineri TaxID=433720 RepID=A0A813PGG9_9BILA|nr:unnamed protein product [Adineta steineri]
MADTKEYEAAASHTLLEMNEATTTGQPPKYGAFESETPASVANHSSETIVVSVPELFGHDPMECLCWNCHTRIVTRVGKKIGYLPWIACMALVTLCCWCGCCLIPFCVKDLKDTNHYCPKCETLLARKERV